MKKTSMFLMVAFLSLFAFQATAEEAKKAATPAPVPAVTYETYKYSDVKVGDKIGLIPLKTLDGKQTDLMTAAKPGVSTVVFFTNSTCASCRSEAALLASIKEDLKEKFHLVGVLTDMSDSGYTSLDKAVRDSISFLHDPEFKVPPAFGFEYTPALIVIRDGKLKASKGGFNPARDSQSLTEFVVKNL